MKCVVLNQKKYTKLCTQLFPYDTKGFCIDICQKFYIDDL